jgi:nicotinate-nucleotide adenylyltransferase
MLLAKTHWCKMISAEHIRATGLATATGNDETSVTSQSARAEIFDGKFTAGKLAMNIGLFGGSFDPIHRGHLALAKAAASRYSLRQVLFVPANLPPHKQKYPLTAFIHRYAMVTLAAQDERAFIPSLLEAPEITAKPRSAGRPRARHELAEGAADPAPDPVNYSIDTVRRLKSSLKKADRLFFLMGIDAFRDIAKWREANALLSECDFVVASRPGYSLRDVAESLPKASRPPATVTRPFHKQPATGDLVLPGVTLHFLEGVHQNISATTIRSAAAQGKPLTRWLDPRVADYIRKHSLYREKHVTR